MVISLVDSHLCVINIRPYFTSLDRIDVQWKTDGAVFVSRDTDPEASITCIQDILSAS